jgi:hypothetical protein
LKDPDVSWLERFAGENKWSWKRELHSASTRKEDIQRLHQELYYGPECRGVYTILWNRPVNRCVGRSRILYVGHSHGTSVQRRVECTFNPTHGKKGVYDDLEQFKRLVAREGKSTKVFFTYLRTRSDRAKSKEREILLAYRKTYAELPPFNRSIPSFRKRKRKRT